VAIRLGMHFMASGTAVRGAVDVAAAERWLVQAPERCGLTALGTPQVQCPEGRLVGVVLLAESHASVHGDAASQTVYVDVFSCAGLDVDVLSELAAEIWGGDWQVETRERVG